MSFFTAMQRKHNRSRTPGQLLLIMSREFLKSQLLSSKTDYSDAAYKCSSKSKASVDTRILSYFGCCNLREQILHFTKIWSIEFNISKCSRWTHVWYVCKFVWAQLVKYVCFLEKNPCGILLAFRLIDLHNWVEPLFFLMLKMYWPISDYSSIVLQIV